MAFSDLPAVNAFLNGLSAIFMGIASIKFKNGDMEAMGKNLGGAVCLFLVPKIGEVILAWAAQ